MSQQLIRDHISRDLDEAFKQMHEGVRQGVIVGAVFGLALKGRRYHVNVAGTLVKDPTFGRGICSALDDELQAMVQGGATSDTTL